ncbi:MAG: 1-acyl-sn-glycerol-3-phosphate acyltransferase [Sulfurimonas sp.]|jgi:long-chain acyl-CoA synthetase
MDLNNKEQLLLSYSPYIKEALIVMRDGHYFAFVYPDFDALKEAKIINITEEIRWYGVELYNIDAKAEDKIKGYKILLSPIGSRTIDELFSDKEEHIKEDDIDDDIYKILRGYISTITKRKIYPSSHLELDLGLDSLNYVELFVFIEQSFGVKIDEAIFSNIMSMRALHAYIKKNSLTMEASMPNWDEILKEDIDEKLYYSPIIMSMYKSVLFPLFKLYFRLEVKGAENIPSYPCILAPSHQSMLDGFLIEAILPYAVLKKSFFLAYKQVFGTKILGPISKHGQTILIDANQDLKHTMQYCALPLREGNNLVIFPEGARTRDRELLEFRPFFAMLSKIFNIPVVPITIDGSYEALETGKVFPKPKKIIVTFSAPIYPANLSVEQITRLTKESIKDKLSIKRIK